MSYLEAAKAILCEYVQGVVRRGERVVVCQTKASHTRYAMT